MTIDLNSRQQNEQPNLGYVVLRHKDPQSHILAAPGAVHSLPAAQISRHEGKQVAWLGKGIIPHRKVPVTSGEVSLRLEVSVTQEDGVGRLGRLDAGDVLGHDIGAVHEEGNAAEPLGLTLKEVPITHGHA